MKITLINDDDSMGVDGVFFLGLDFSGVPDDVNAVHWKDGVGIIEYYNSTNKPDEPITELPDWVQAIKDQWDVAKAAKDQADADFARQMHEIQVLAQEMEARRLAEQQMIAERQASPIDPITLTTSYNENRT